MHQDKVVFITGAAKGQGRAVALAFAKEGANIIGFDLEKKISYPAYNNANQEDLKKLEKEVHKIGSKIVTFGGDVRNSTDVKAAVEKGISEFNHIDILFNNAGICAYGKSWELSEKEWDSMIGINLTGSWLVSKYVIPYLIKQAAGVIIYNSSIGGLRGMNRLAHYSASKHGLVGLTKSQAIELAPYNIRVISIHPTGVDTPMNDGIAALEGSTPEKIAESSATNLIPVPWIEPVDVAKSVLFLASDDAKYITGSQYVLDAGLLTK
ncbi:mycofactocin-coupled SDR family oxidoreductase [Loigolactobacillus backii]|uniref:mycofactocin-coupled SDR family oxidoreductase n=1 Tax=Loigolactobacillus backii TaxID=375175 RepID=UPI0022FD5968|nr:mycofactocin-coupled SDR family oxidoreductase [Loigolactobacillus backii]MDA5388947.1 mycofactocin-coupled SDR family oxidoreductase [Loigolactobacillus backii]MDA5391454.1 mycofactocin-coupled SDR family oxidoreductase [Loigolactobacillus backii]